MAIVWTLKPCSSLTPLLAGVGIRCRFWKGRRSPRSKIDPRSTQNGSPRWPAKTLIPPDTVCTAADARSSYFGVERGPMRQGGVGRLLPSTLDLPPATRVTVYDWRRFQLGSVSDAIGPVLYRNVLRF